MLSMVLIWGVESIGHGDMQQLCSISVFWQDVLNIMTVGLSYTEAFQHHGELRKGA